MEVTRLFDLLPHYAEHFPTDNALNGKENGIWVNYSISQYIEKVNNISYGLMQLGIKKGDRIASISNSRPEWNLLDMAIMQLGAMMLLCPTWRTTVLSNLSVISLAL